MDLGLKGKTAIVTGGAKGIGREISRTLLEEGCQVCIVGTDQAALDAAAAEFSSLGPCMARRCNVTDAAQIDSMFAAVLDRFGAVDILVNNAGLLQPVPIEQMSEEHWDRSINVNLKSVFLCTKAAIGPMKRAGGGVIINASSFAAQIPSYGQSAYAAAKIAVKSFTQVSAAELAPYGIRVLAYIPGVINTQLIAPMTSSPARVEKLKNDIALHRFGEPVEVARTVVFMASDKAGYMSGCSVEIHGGKLCVQSPGMAWES